MAVYLDLVVLLNGVVDFLLLLGTNRLSGFPGEPVRCGAAAMLGGVYSGACLLPGFRFLGNLLWRWVSLGLVAVIAFGYGKSAWRRGGVFVLLSMALGGIAVSMGRQNFGSVILGAVFCGGLCHVAFGQGVGQREYVPLTLHWGEKTVSIVALRDSGNTLRDPITGEQVLVAAGEIGERLTGLTREQLRDPLGTLARRPIAGLRLIPYRAVGSSSGMLLAVRMDRVKVGTREQSAIVAFAPEGLGNGEIYQALTGGAV